MAKIIGINASFLRKPDSGMGQVSFNFLKKLFQMKKDGNISKDLSFILYLEKDVGLELPDGFEKRIFLPKIYKRDDLVRKIIWEKWLLSKKIKEDGCAVFFSLYQSATILDIPHLLLVHDTIWKIFPEYLNNNRKKIYYHLVNQAIRKADKIITISQNSKKDMEKHFGVLSEKVKVANIDCDDIFKEKIADENNLTSVSENYIFYFGGFDVRKNVDNLLESYGILWKNWRGDRKNFPDLVLGGKFHPHLVPLITNIPQKKEEICQKYKLASEKIKLLDFFIQQKDLPKFYRDARVFCFPSLYEGFGLPPLEAQNCGCPVTAMRNSSLSEVLSEGSAILVDENSPQKIALALERVLLDEFLRSNLVEKGYQNAKRFDWENFVREALKEIEFLLNIK